MRTSSLGIRLVTVALLAVLAALALSSAAFAENEGAGAEDEILIGLIPEENIFRAMEKYRTLASYMSNKLGIRVRFTILSRYGDIIDRFTSRGLDGAFFGIYTSALAKEQLGVEPLVRPVNIDGSTTAKGYLFTRKDSGITTLEDARGARAAFVDRATATGYVFAIAYLRQAGINDPEAFFSEISFSGSHETTIFTVVDGRAEIGAAKGRVLERLSVKDPIIKEDILILAESEELPDNTLCLSKDVDPVIKKRIKQILLEMDKDPDGAEVLEKLRFRKFIDAGDEDFRTFIGLAQKAGIDIKK